MERGPRGRENSRADMVIVARIVVTAWHVMGMAVLGMIGAVIGLGHHCAGAMLDGLDGRRSDKG
jgi:hypothetical protein